MKTSTKALLLSALVFPGLGHFVLKRRGRAIALIGITALVAGIYFQQGLQLATSIADGIQNGSIALDTAAIESSIQQGEPQSMVLTAYLLMACWIVGVVDVIRIGRQQDRDAATAP